MIKDYEKKLADYLKRIEMSTSSMDEWHRRRFFGIGGSEIATVLGCNKYQTPFELWQVKTCRTPSFGGNTMTRLGHVFEQFVAEEYVRITGNAIAIDETHYNGSSFGCPYLVGNIDRMVTCKDGSKRILEVKTCRNKNHEEDNSKDWGDGNLYFPDGRVAHTDDNVPTSYYLQVQHYMLLTGIQICDLIVMFRDSTETKIYTILGDKEIQEQIINAATSFWKCVLDDVPPFKSVKDLKAFVPEKGTSVELESKKILEGIFNLGCLKEQKKAIEEQIDVIEDEIKMYIGERENLTLENKIIYSFKSQSKTSFDSDKFKTEHPDEYLKYLKTSNYRVLRKVNSKK